MKVAPTVWVELGFEIEANYSPGRPATPPSYASGGDPPEPAEWDLETLSDIIFEHRQWNSTLQKHENVKCSLFKHIEPEMLAVVRKALAEAITASELEEVFAEAVCDEATKDA